MLTMTTGNKSQMTFLKPKQQVQLITEQGGLLTKFSLPYMKYDSNKHIPWNRVQILYIPVASCVVWRPGRLSEKVPRCLLSVHAKSRCHVYLNFHSFNPTVKQSFHLDFSFKFKYETCFLLQQFYIHFVIIILVFSTISHLSQVCECGNTLDGFSETHFICQDPIDALIIQVSQPVHTLKINVIKDCGWKRNVV